jgi:hypothetical protein
LPSTGLSEIAIVYEVSARFLANNFHVNICNALINFVNNLPNNVMVSITPIATEFLLDPSTTNSNALFNNLSPTTNDETAIPALFPLSRTQAWTSSNYSSIANLFYINGQYAIYPTDPNVLMSYQSPSKCTIPVPNYNSCSPLTWPTVCPGTKNTSCSQVYTYISNSAYPVLPLTLNKTLIVNYLENLRAFAASADGLFTSLISWGWRTIDPSWSNFWQINSSATSTVRASGQYPNPYGSSHNKNMILIFNSTPYWNDYAPDIAAYYINKCGNATTVVNGLNHWWLTSYGMVPVPTDYQSYVNDITCENRWYNTMDNTLGLNLSSNAYNSTVASTTYSNDILTAINSKFFRICNNIKAKNINVYLLSNSNTATLAPCCNTSANAYTIGNSSTSISTALSAIQSQILASGG